MWGVKAEWRRCFAYLSFWLPLRFLNYVHPSFYKVASPETDNQGRSEKQYEFSKDAGHTLRGAETKSEISITS